MRIQLRKDIKTFVFVALSLMFICFIPMYGNLFTYSTKDVIVEKTELQYVSVKNQCVEQHIYVEGNIKNFKIYFYAPSGILYDEATVKISILQGEEEKAVDIVKARRIPVESSYDRHEPISEEEEKLLRYNCYIVDADFSAISTGDAVLRIEGENIPEGTDLFCMVSGTLTSGLPSATANDTELGHPLAIEYEIVKHNQYYYYDITMIIILSVIILGIAGVFAYREKLLKKTNVLYVCAFALIFVCISIQTPTATFYGTPRSEAVYEFWYKAHSMTFLESLMSLMSGESLAWLERIIMWCADKMVPVQYVFVAAQMMEVCFISAVTAMPCLKTFQKYFNELERLIFSILLGVFSLFLKTYYFWSVSYWAFIFIMLFCFVDMDRLKKRHFVYALVFSVILCISRIFHIMFIPVAVILLIAIGRERGRRFRIYCYTIIGASAFEGIYSTMAGTSLTQESGMLENIMDIGVWRIIENTIFYEVQVINSFLFGKEHMIGFTSNMIGLAIIAGIFIYCMYSFMGKHGPKKMGCLLLGLGILSFGTIAITVVTSGSYAQVQFPHNYATVVDWGENYFQEADLHFSYAYICLLFILYGLAYAGRERIMKMINENVSDEIQSRVKERAGQAFACGIVLFGLGFVIVNAKEREKIDNSLAADWSAFYGTVDQASYFMPVNVIYRAAQISMEHNSETWIYGVGDDGKGYFWKNGDDVYTFEKPYSIAEIGAVSDIDEREVLTITAKKAITNFDITYVAVLKDKYGNVIKRVEQANSPERVWIDFVLDEPMEEIYCIEFETLDGNVAYVKDAVQIGVQSFD